MTQEHCHSPFRLFFPTGRQPRPVLRDERKVVRPWARRASGRPRARTPRVWCCFGLLVQFRVYQRRVLRRCFTMRIEPFTSTRTSCGFICFLLSFPGCPFRVMGTPAQRPSRVSRISSITSRTSSDMTASVGGLVAPQSVTDTHLGRGAIPVSLFHSAGRFRAGMPEFRWESRGGHRRIPGGRGEWLGCWDADGNPGKTRDTSRVGKEDGVE